MVALVVADGANNLILPVTILEDYSSAQKWIMMQLGDEYRHLFNGSQVDLSDLNDNEREKVLVPNFFSYYYGGCGQCGNIYIIEMDYGETPFVFDLD